MDNNPCKGALLRPIRYLFHGQGIPVNGRKDCQTFAVGLGILATLASLESPAIWL